MQKNSLRSYRDYLPNSVLCFFILFSTGTDLFSQPLSIKPKSPVVCYQNSKASPDHIQAPENFQQWRKNNSARLKTANFEVQYIGFPPDNQAKNAFQFAVDIWETQLVSPVPIRIQAQWGQLDNGVLGQAIWGSAFANFDGAQHLNTYYPVALAEKIAGHDLNDPTDPDIVATFNSGTNWYLGTDGNVPAGRMDLVTIVLHEIAHGLGFSDTYDGEGTQGSVGLENGSIAIPFVYDLFITNASNQNLYTSFFSPSAQLKTQLTSNNLSYNSPLAVATLGSRPKVYAPNPFNQGSSIAHLDETFFSTPGDANKLMTPQIGTQEVIHSPGPLLKDIFSDMGWVFTKIKHTPLKDTERKNGLPYVVTVEIISDNGYDADEVILNYTTNGSTFTEVIMTATGNANEFQAGLPGTTTDGTYGYFVSVTDILGREFTNPGKVQTQNQQPAQDMIVFEIGVDDEAPEIAHTPVDFVFEDDTELLLSARVTDNMDVASVSVAYSIDGGSIQILSMSLTSSLEDEYTATISIPSSLAIGDLITYRIIAMDNSTNSNQAIDPAEDMYTVFVTGTMPVQDSYVNTFNEPSFDFIGINFKIETPDGFENGAIHSAHPYENGSGPGNESNYIYQLQIPIRLDASNPIIRFDEIVLVEPGEDGSDFGDDDFYDFVVVEGSADGGVTWTPFADGYDSGDKSAWLTRYNSSISSDNSQATGEPELFFTRSIDMLESNSFANGDEVLIRFRLFADQAAHGWGWAIDNLSIQGPITGIEESIERKFLVYPNPATRTIAVELNIPEVSSADIRIMNLQGQHILTEELHREGNVLRKEIDISFFQNGLYILEAKCEGKVIHKKFLKIPN
jgi:hypothetical protein